MSKKGSKAREAKKGTQGGDGLALRELLRVPGGKPVELAAHAPRETPAGPSHKQAGLAAMTELADPLADLQERLWAASTAGDRRRILLVLQGMDTSGKGGTVKHVIGLFNPAGCRVHAFKAPTPKELGYPFLWRITRALPQAGELGIFDRSHYEDVLVARVHALARTDEIERRYDEINRFERSLADNDVTVIKCFLHISYDEQRDRLLKRLDRPDKHWKFHVSDIDERALWPAYQQAYELALERCSTPHAPWYLIPADRKWYRNWAISRLLLEHLVELDPRHPEADFDVEEARRRLLEQ
jgi:PPK2 family polyphosphate:nucleotide phosphotransferase